MPHSEPVPTVPVSLPGPIPTPSSLPLNATPSPSSSQSTNIQVIPLHPTFAAEIRGVTFPPSPATFGAIKSAITTYGVLVFRKTGINDATHVSFASLFGDLDDVTPYTTAGKKHRLSTPHLFDVSNLDENGAVAAVTTQRHAFNKGNGLFHVDSSFNPRRASYSLLRAAALPPAGTGGATEFADTRTAFADLPEDVKHELWDRDYVACHSLLHSRRTAAPDALGHLRPETGFMSRHHLAQVHEPSGRWNLYIASHVHHVEGLGDEESRKLVQRLYTHACRAEYVVSVPWLDEGDLVVWDNTCVMHRATGGSYEGKFVRDMRRATVHDGSSQAWGLNEKVDTRQGFP